MCHLSNIKTPMHSDLLDEIDGDVEDNEGQAEEEGVNVQAPDGPYDI